MNHLKKPMFDQNVTCVKSFSEKYQKFKLKNTVATQTEIQQMVDAWYNKIP